MSNITYAEVTLECPCGNTLDVIWRGQTDNAEEIIEDSAITATERDQWGGEFCKRCAEINAWHDRGCSWHD